MNKIKIGKKYLSNNEVFFIIEEGNVAWGDFNKAKKMIKIASETGADAIEFQLARVDEFYKKSEPAYKIWKELEYSNDQIKELIELANSNNLEFIAAPLSVSIIKFLAEQGCSAFNINASDITNPQIIDAVVSTGLPFFLSLPLATEEEINWAIARINDNAKNNLILLLGQHPMASGHHGVEISDMNLGYINTLKNQFNCLVGFIDHSPLIWTPALAIASGACVITKHLAISRSEKSSDWQICLEPDEMKDSVNIVRYAKESLNAKNKRVAVGENMDRSIMRRSILSARNISIGKIIEIDDLVFKRPGIGIPPSDFELLLGKKAKKNLNEDEILNINDFE
ncbi:MAG: hypothetical protein A2046_04735 [Bacteroidetes bacterium GWA2_30_7]|nr:MAG: hypothetical protein A2046_04735 [Bacteroidetes bacterium GWA2_30_7]